MLPKIKTKFCFSTAKCYLILFLLIIRCQIFPRNTLIQPSSIPNGGRFQPRCCYFGRIGLKIKACLLAKPAITGIVACAGDGSKKYQCPWYHTSTQLWLPCARTWCHAGVPARRAGMPTLRRALIKRMACPVQLAYPNVKTDIVSKMRGVWEETKTMLVLLVTSDVLPSRTGARRVYMCVFSSVTMSGMPDRLRNKECNFLYKSGCHSLRASLTNA